MMVEALGAARTRRIPKQWAPKKYPLLKPKNVALEHRHFVIGNRTSNDPLSIAMFQCTVIAILIFGVSSRNLRKITFKTQKRHVCSHGLMRKTSVRKLKRCPKVGNSNMWKHLCFHAILVVLGHLSFPRFSQAQAFYLYLMKQPGPLQLLLPRPGGKFGWTIY